MSDSTEIPEKRDTDTFDVIGKEFAAYLAEHCKQMRCPACGSESEPVLDADSAEGPVHLMTAPIAKPRGYGSKGFCTAICPSCGFAWMFQAAVVVDWVVEKRQEGGHINE